MQVEYTYDVEQTGGRAMLHQAIVAMLTEAFGPLQSSEADGVLRVWAEGVTMDDVKDALHAGRLVRTADLAILADDERQYDEWKLSLDGYSFVSPSGRSLRSERRQQVA